MLLKRVKITNPKNVLVQIPLVVSSEYWKVKKDERLEVHYDEQSDSIIIRRKETQTGSDIDEEDERVPREPIRLGFLQGV